MKTDCIFQKKNQIDVFVALLPAYDGTKFYEKPLFPPERQAEILACLSEKTKHEKYFAWMLLSIVTERRYGKALMEFSFRKTETGKWACDEFEFSLSHSENAVCVALYNRPIGVDIQQFKPLKTTDFSHKILSETELAEYVTLPETEKNDYLIRAWTKKEAAFKALGQRSFFGANPKNLTGNTMQNDIFVGEARYSLAVASSDDDFCVHVHHITDIDL